MQDKPVLGPSHELGWQQNLQEIRFQQAQDGIGLRFAQGLRQSSLQSVSTAAALLQGSVIGALAASITLSSAIPVYLCSVLGAFVMASNRLESSLHRFLAASVTGLGMAEILAQLLVLPGSLELALSAFAGLCFAKGYHDHGVDMGEGRMPGSYKAAAAGLAMVLSAGAMGVLALPVIAVLLPYVMVSIPELVGRQISRLTLPIRLRRLYEREQYDGVREPMDSVELLEFFNKDVLEGLLQWKSELKAIPSQAHRQNVSDKEIAEAYHILLDIERLSDWFQSRVLVLKGLEDRLSSERIARLRHSPKIHDFEKRLQSPDLHPELSKLAESLEEEFRWAEDFAMAEQEVSGEKHAVKALQSPSSSALG